MLIKVRVTTGAKNEKVKKVADDHFEISVREKPENNAANHRIIALVAMALRVPIKAVRIIKGHRSPSKILSIGKN